MLTLFLTVKANRRIIGIRIHNLATFTILLVGKQRTSWQRSHYGLDLKYSEMKKSGLKNEELETVVLCTSCAFLRDQRISTSGWGGCQIVWTPPVTTSCVKFSFRGQTRHHPVRSSLFKPLQNLVTVEYIEAVTAQQWNVARDNRNQCVSQLSFL